MTITRQILLETLVKNLRTLPFCLAAWEGGAATNNRVDQFSDLDLIFCVEDESVEETFRQVDSILNTIGKIEHRYRAPEPSWNNHSQCYYKMTGMPEYFFIDIVILKKSSSNKPLEKERHGIPIVHFDKINIVEAISVDWKEFRQRLRNRVEVIESSFPIYKAIVIKELQRQRALDALAFYRILTGFYVELVGMKHRPFHYDFGLRYAHTELPPEIQIEILNYSYLTNIEDLRGRLDPLCKQINDSIESLKSAD